MYLTMLVYLQLLTDGSIQVLFPDGAVSKCQSYPVKAPPAPPTSKPSSAVTKQDPSLAAARRSLRGPSLTHKPSEEPLVPVIALPEKVPEWSSTGIDGNRVLTNSDGSHVTIPGVHCSQATCSQSGQVGIEYIGDCSDTNLMLGPEASTTATARKWYKNNCTWFTLVGRFLCNPDHSDVAKFRKG